jgi:uncharacterized lipoprotein
MRRLVLAGVAVLAAALLSGCSSQQLLRVVYESFRTYDESIRETPMEQSLHPRMSFDEYDKERRAREAKPTE